MCNKTDAREHRNKGVMARALGKKTRVRLHYKGISTWARAQVKGHKGNSTVARPQGNGTWETVQR